MVLVMVRQEAGPRERWAKMLKGELKNSKSKGPSQKTSTVMTKRNYN
jgi:hypothetical protein